MSRVVPDYPPWWNTTITVFNKYEDPLTHTITWYKTVVPGCFWQFIGSKLTVKQVVLDASSITCRIPQDTNFMRKSEWVNLPNDQMHKYFTLGLGDIIVAGAVSDIIDEYTTGHRSTDVLNKYSQYQECIEIGSVAINIGGSRNHPHYLITDGDSRTWSY